VGAFSAVKVAVLANIPPMPMPLITRKKVSISTEFDHDVANTLNPINKLQIKIIDFLPILSALGAKNIAPIDIPNSPALNTIPNDCGLIDQSLEIFGEAYETTITSMPSSIFIKKQMRIVDNWRFEIFEIVVSGSMAFYFRYLSKN
jgi:hypothetical protein